MMNNILYLSTKYTTICSVPNFKLFVLIVDVFLRETSYVWSCHSFIVDSFATLIVLYLMFKECFLQQIEDFFVFFYCCCFV